MLQYRLFFIFLNNLGKIGEQKSLFVTSASAKVLVDRHVSDDTNNVLAVQGVLHVQV